jgi:phytol kinase
MLQSNWLAMVITFAAAILWLRLNDYLAHRGWISSSLSRKIIHIGTGPIFVLCWILFNEQPEARYLAVVVPFAVTIQFALVGLGIMKDPAAVAAMSRTGDRMEILRGPLYYGIVFILLTLAFWKDSPVGMVALMMMCGGDGLADVVGKRVRSPKLPWSPKKSLAGFISVFIGGWIFATLVLAVQIAAGTFAGSIADMLVPITIISVAATLVESLPTPDIDNLTVAGTAVLLGILLF